MRNAITDMSKLTNPYFKNFKSKAGIKLKIKFSGVGANMDYTDSVVQDWEE